MKKISLIFLMVLCGTILPIHLVFGETQTGATNDQPIVIGHQVDKTGGFASWGYWIDKAAEAAVNDINKEGGINGRMLLYKPEDTESNPQIGIRKFRKLVHEDKADVVLGAVHSGVMMASLPLAKE